MNRLPAERGQHSCRPVGEVGDRYECECGNLWKRESFGWTVEQYWHERQA